MKKIKRKDALRLMFYEFKEWVSPNDNEELKTFWHRAGNFLDEILDDEENYYEFEDFKTDWEEMTKGIMIIRTDKQLREIYNSLLI